MLCLTVLSFLLVSFGADVSPYYVAPRLGTPCASVCAEDPSSSSCQTCCTTVKHEIDWKCGQVGESTCCSNWTPQCWDWNSVDNFFHACDQCGGYTCTDVSGQLDASGIATVDIVAPMFTGVMGMQTSSCNPEGSTSYTMVGTYIVPCSGTYDIGMGPVPGSCNITVTITDMLPPTITCPGNVMTPNQIVTFNPIADDNSGSVTTSCTPPSGSSFNFGTATVACTAIDPSGNTNLCMFTVAVFDVEPPTITCPGIQQFNADVGGFTTINYNPATATDNDGSNPVINCAPGSGTTFSNGIKSVQCNATDLSGNVASCTLQLNVLDVTPPVISTKSDVPLEANSPSGYTGYSFTYPTALDDASTPSVTCNSTSPGDFSFGATTVTCTATDAAGNTDTTSFVVTVSDTIPPTVTPNSNITAEATTSSGTPITYTAPAAMDATGTSSTCGSLPSGATFPLGVTPVTCTITDAGGNSVMSQFFVIITDLTPPNITTNSDLTTEATSASGAVVTFSDPSASDITGIMAVSCSPASGTTFGITTTTVTCTALDNYGNSASSTFTITVEDTTPPDFPTPTTDFVVNATNTSGAVVTFTTPDASDATGVMAVTCSPSSGSLFDFGMNTVTCTATDNYGHSTDTSFVVTVEDVTLPTVSVPADFAVEAEGPFGATVTFVVNFADDIAISMSGCVPASGTNFTLGDTTVTCDAVDTSSNSQTATFVVTVQDTIPPVVTVPSPITVEADNVNGKAVDFAITVTDLTDTTTVCNATSGDQFAVGSRTVSCDVTDQGGNTVQVSFSITVADTIPPVLDPIANQTLELASESGTQTSWTTTFTDATTVSVNCNATVDSTYFPLGTTLVTCTGTDDGGNTDTKSFYVIVVDTTAPVLTQPGNQTIERTTQEGATATYQVDQSDYSGPNEVVCDTVSGSPFPMGDTLVTCTATDISGNTGSVEFIITVEDTIPPVIQTEMGASTLEAEGPDGASTDFYVNQYGGLVADDTAASILSYNCVPNMSLFPLGITTVTCTVSDGFNSVQSSANVTVVDTTPPSFTQTADQVVEATGSDGAAVTWTVEVADLVTANPTVSCTHVSGAVYSLGDTTVTCNATDDAGNSDSMSFLITVVDTTAPVVTIPTNQILEATSGSGREVTFSATASDIVSGTLTPTCTSSPTGYSSGSTFPLGTTTITCSAQDNAGNQDQGSFNITIRDTTAPVITVPSNIVRDAPTSAGITVTYNVTASDAVTDPVTVTCTSSPTSGLSSGSTFAMGVTTITCNAQDAAGNAATQRTFTITINVPCPWALNSTGGCSSACVHFGCGYTDLTIGCTNGNDEERTCTCPDGETVGVLAPGEIFVGCGSSSTTPSLDEILAAIQTSPEPFQAYFNGYTVTIVSVDSDSKEITISFSPVPTQDELDNLVDDLDDLLDVDDMYDVSVESLTDNQYLFTFDEVEVDAASMTSVGFVTLLATSIFVL